MTEKDYMAIRNVRTMLHIMSDLNKFTHNFTTDDAIHLNVAVHNLDYILKRGNDELHNG